VRLRRVELIGFKSFMDRTVLDFRTGVTTILGPNGCGKSNVVDAVRWVLGEQSAKQLRGERMDDVIFKGTQKRKPLSVAEVSLVFDDIAGELRVPFSEVAISRRVTREGVSDYFLNKAPCRLKDIKDLFYDTGVGNNAYSIIEQEVVGQVLSPSEDKVRTILEEGSGVVRYKVKRKEALRKLEQTERDLLRVEDIIEEIATQVRSLARQVGKARRHQRLFGELRALELIRADHLSRELHRELAQLQDRSQQLRAEDVGDDAELARQRVRVEQMRPEIDELEAQRRAREHELTKVEAALAQTQGEILVLREKADSGGRRGEEIAAELARARERAAQLAAEHEAALAERAALTEDLAVQDRQAQSMDEELRAATRRHDEVRAALARAQQLSLGFLQEEAEHKSEVAAVQARLHALCERRDGIAAQLADASARRARHDEARATAVARGAEIARRRTQLEQELAAAQRAEAQAEEQLEQALEARAAANDELARAESRLEIAQRIAKEYEGYRTGTARLLKAETTRRRVRGALAEQVRIEPGWESAFELLFGEDADALLVDRLDEARDLAGLLAREDLGRCSFLVDLHGGPAAADEDAAVPGRPAHTLAKADGPARQHVARWLSRVRVVDTAEEAARAAVAHAGAGFSFLAREGLLVRHDGLVRGGSGARRELSLFGRQEQVALLTSTVQQLRDGLQHRLVALHATEEARDGARRDAGSALARLQQTELESAEAVRDLAARHEQLEREEQACAELGGRADEVRLELAQVEARLGELRASLGRHGEDQQASQERVNQLAQDVTRLEREREEALTRLGELRLTLSHHQGVERELISRTARLQAMEAELAELIHRRVEESAGLAVDLETWLRTIQEREGALAGLFQQREERGELLRQAREAIDAQRQQLEAAQDAMRVIAERQRAKSDALHELQQQETRAALTLQNTQERIQEKFQTTIEQGLATIQPEQLPPELIVDSGSYPVQQVEELLADRRDRIEKLGPVNFTALEEYEAKKSRLEFLEKQRDDLLASKADLLQAIDRINRTARQMFRETFDKVRNNFREIFSTLFEGGEADLELVSNDDPLESDILIHARPRGKKVDSVALLSGGERALTAIALLFAVYLIKPSPFCLLDEVDAPLDDVNVKRFVRLLERFADRTQFIVITHNKLTMEAADHLYGVTMEESGVSRLVSVSFEEVDTDDPLQALRDTARRRVQEAAGAGAAAAAEIGAPEAGALTAPAVSAIAAPLRALSGEA
jgi:chromosome segregation protein